jgi:PAT family beta-lactamase induction signal transducer AmpG
VILAVLTLAVLLLPPAERASADHGSLWAPLQALLARRDVWAVALFALLFKLDIAAMEPMTRPFWVDRGFTLEEIGAILTTGRIIATVSGAVLGGILTTRWGIFRALWVLGLVQALSNLTYWAAAEAGAPTALMYGAAVVEQFTGGMGTAAFLTFLMTLSSRRYAATQFALLSALYRLAGIAASNLSGVLATRMGYASYFLLTFALALPAFALLPWVGRAEARE